MRVIDLLVKITNGEIPKKIIFDGEKYIWCEEQEEYRRYPFNNDLYYSLWKDYDLIKCLYEEVEIIEDNKKIEKIEINDECIVDYDEDGKRCFLNTNRKDRNIYIKKINQIIDKLNEMNK